MMCPAVTFTVGQTQDTSCKMKYGSIRPEHRLLTALEGVFPESRH